MVESTTALDAYANGNPLQMESVFWGKLLGISIWRGFGAPEGFRKNPRGTKGCAHITATSARQAQNNREPQRQQQQQKQQFSQHGARGWRPRLFRVAHAVVVFIRSLSTCFLFEVPKQLIDMPPLPPPLTTTSPYIQNHTPNCCNLGQ